MNTKKYSQYFDNNFNFNNIVENKYEDINSKKNMYCDGDIMLEPRLQEYLKKKKFHKENNIEPCISIEQEFRITLTDKKLLRAFLKGKKDIYNNNKYNLNIKNKNKKRFFP